MAHERLGPLSLLLLGGGRSHRDPMDRRACSLTILVLAAARDGRAGDIERSTVADAIAKYGVDTTDESPWTR
jgi:uncharacterized membrane protein YebE (DUF533 family)